MAQSNSAAQSNPLKACPDSPNCVSSQASDSHAIDPFILIIDPQKGWQKVISMLSEMDRVRVTYSDDRRLHAEATSQIFRFVDDIDFVFNPVEQRIDIRSASRIGYSDFGVNRKRLEMLRTALQAAKIIQ